MVLVADHERRAALEQAAFTIFSARDQAAFMQEAVADLFASPSP